MNWIKTAAQLPPVDKSNEWRFDREISVEVIAYDAFFEESTPARYYHLKQIWVPTWITPTHWCLIETPTE